MKIIYKCRENQFKEIITRSCTDKEGNELSRATEDGLFGSWLYTEVVQKGACDINATSTVSVEEKPKICVTGFEQGCLE